MINHDKPHGRTRKYPPQKARLCLHCGGRCFCLPGTGVACMDCRGTKWLEVLEADIPAWREQIVKTRKTLDAMTPGITLAEASKLFQAVKNGHPSGNWGGGH